MFEKKQENVLCNKQTYLNTHMCACVHMLYVAVIDTRKHHFNFWSGSSKRSQNNIGCCLVIGLVCLPKLFLKIPSPLDTGLGVVHLELTGILPEYSVSLCLKMLWAFVFALVSPIYLEFTLVCVSRRASISSGSTLSNVL